MNNYGLLPLKEDKRDFKLGAVIDLPELAELPQAFNLDTLPIRHQKKSYFCTEFTYCELSGQQEGVELEPAWSFAMIGALGIDNTYGADLRDSAKPHVKWGAIERSESPYSLENKDPEFLRNPEVWSVDLMELAKKHKKKTYFAVTGKYDHFDNIRASIYKLKDSVAIGLVWCWDMKEVYIDKVCTGGNGHAVAVVGWDGDYLKIKQSYGKESGKDGFQYIHRDIINKNVDRYGAYMFTDLDAPTYVPENEQQNLINDILDMIMLLIQKLKDLLK